RAAAYLRGVPLFFPSRKSSRSGAEFRLAAPKILRLGKNTSELVFSLGLFVLWLCRRYSRSAKCK
ncbi:MAG: hypothetical protein SPH60_09290, partial [Alistipes senegalensis]|nr:hypothetical protein [Alistipes senegalensis]